MIVFFKERNENDTYEQSFRKEGFTDIRFIPLLSFSFVNQNTFEEKLNLEKEKLNFVIITSQRAAEALITFEKGTQFKDLYTKIKKNTIFFTLPAAKKTLLHFGIKKNNLVYKNQENQEKLKNATEIANAVLNYDKITEESNLLFLCGNQRREELPLILKENNYSLIEQVVYETSYASNFAYSLIYDQIYQEKEIEKNIWFFFFSPSGVKCIYETITDLEKQYSLDNSEILDYIKKYVNFGSIGNTTGKEIQNLFSRVDIISSKPNAECLLDSFKNYNNKD